MLSLLMGRSTTIKRRPTAGTAVLGRSFFEIEQKLEEVLRDLANILLSSGYGISRMNRTVRRAYISAARALDSESGRKFTNARIATVTGLSRTEVARLSRPTLEEQRIDKEPANRAQRVTLGWITDTQYCVAPGKPKRLSFSGPGKTFSRLVREYSGDIPARAMLIEMQRLGMATVEKGDKVRLVRLEAPISRQTVATLKAIAPWIRFLSANIRDRELAVGTHEMTLAFSSLPQALAAIRELENRTKAFIRSVKELGNLGRNNGQHVINFSMALATRAPKDRARGESSR